MAGSPLRDPILLDFVDDIPVARLAPLHRVQRAAALVSDAIRRTVAQGHPHLLVDAGDVSFDPPSLAVRLSMVRAWAEAADGRLRIAVVVRPDCIDPDRFGVVAAGNFGLAGQVFDREADAIAWLRAELEADRRTGIADRRRTVRDPGAGENLPGDKKERPGQPGRPSAT